MQAHIFHMVIGVISQCNLIIIVKLFHTLINCATIELLLYNFGKLRESCICFRHQEGEAWVRCIVHRKAYIHYECAERQLWLKTAPYKYDSYRCPGARYASIPNFLRLLNINAAHAPCQPTYTVNIGIKQKMFERGREIGTRYVSLLLVGLSFHNRNIWCPFFHFQSISRSGKRTHIGVWASQYRSTVSSL